MTDLERAVRHTPLEPRAWRALAQAREAGKDLAGALAAYRSGLIVAPDAVDCAMLHANLHFRLARYGPAWRAYRRLMTQVGPRGPLYSNIAACLRKLGQPEQALTALRRALTLKPPDALAWRNLGNLLRAGDRLDDADRLYRRALAITPDDANLRWNRSMVLLKAGRLRDGFREFEWRWHGDRYSPRQRRFDMPVWRGQPFDGRTLYVHAEQGFGDALQFARFLTRAAARKGARGRVVFECHPELLSMVDRISGVDAVVGRGETPPPADFHAPLLSLPAILGVEEETDLATDIPYISPPTGARFDTPEIAPGRLNVGFVFAGNPNYPGDRERSTRLSDWAPVIGVGGVRLICLQKGAAEPSAADLPAGVVALNARIGSFTDTAIAMRRLDLVISTCTSTAHLAGALGVPVWIALARNADWRWMLERRDSPWYPSARLYRQSAPGDWPGVFHEIARDLAALARRSPPKRNPPRPRVVQLHI